MEQPIKSSAIGTYLRFLFVAGIALLPGLFVTGQVKFTTVASSREIGVNDYLQLEFVVENARQIDDLTPPEFQGFHVAQGPIQSSGMSIVNGNMSQYKAISFVLQPSRTGTFTIGGASATVDGKHMRSNSVTIVVKTGGGNSSPNSSGNSRGNNPLLQPFGSDPFSPDPGEEVDRDYILKPGENVKDKIRKNLFVKVQVDKNTCYVGEPIVATYKLYSRLSSESRVTKRPSLNGFSVYDMVDPSADIVTVEKLNGKPFTVHTIRKTQLIPLQSGTIDLDPVEVENTVHFVRSDGSSGHRHGANSIRDLIDEMAGDNNTGQEVDENVTLDTKPLTITVKPLPEENKPAGYNGAVGSFSIEASLPARSVAAQDQETLHVVVKGKGNLPVITAPSISWPSGMDAFDPTAKEDVNKTVAPMNGSKSFDYLFSANTPGQYTIPAINFSWFDPASQTYKTAGTTPLEIQVTPAIRKPKTSPSNQTAPAEGGWTMSKLRNFVQDHLEWLFAVLLFSGVVGWFWRQNLRLRKATAEKTAAEKAVAGKTPSPLEEKGNHPILPVIPSATYIPESIAVDPLQEARQFFDEGDYKNFYREVNRAVWKAIGKKLELPASELNKQNTLRLLEARGWDAHALVSLEDILNECEMNLYTPAYDRYNMQLLLKQVEPMLDRLS